MCLLEPFTDVTDEIWNWNALKLLSDAICTIQTSIKWCHLHRSNIDFTFSIYLAICCAFHSIATRHHYLVAFSADERRNTPKCTRNPTLYCHKNSSKWKKTKQTGRRLLWTTVRPYHYRDLNLWTSCTLIHASMWLAKRIHGSDDVVLISIFTGFTNAMVLSSNQYHMPSSTNLSFFSLCIHSIYILLNGLGAYDRRVRPSAITKFYNHVTSFNCTMCKGNISQMLSYNMQ